MATDDPTRVRKVKCDEAKPSCLRCLKTGRKCEGYPELNRLLHQAASQSLVMARSPQSLEFESPASGRAFDYYRSQSAPILGNIMDSEFWGGLVMRLSISEPIVKHAILSLSSLHEFMGAHKADKRLMNPQMIFSEYTKSIRALSTWKDGNGKVVPLIASILFTCIEFLLDNEPGSRMHIMQGRKLLGDLGSATDADMDVIRRELVPMYTRLGLAAFLYGGSPPAVPDHLKTFVKPPNELNTLAEARSLLYSLLDEVMRFSLSVQARIFAGTLNNDEVFELTARQALLQSYLDQWQTAYMILTTGTKQSHTMSATQNLMQIYYHATTTWLGTALSTQQTEFDAFLPQFASIIGLASSIVNNAHRGSNLHAFSFETEIVAPVYWAAIKCRHPLLRRAAVKLLMREEMKGRRENLWHANEAIVIALHIIQLEEQEVDPVASSMSPESPFSSTDSSSHMSTTTTSVDFQIPIHKPPTMPPSDFKDILYEERGDSFDHEINMPTPTPSDMPTPTPSATTSTTVDFNTLPASQRILKNIDWSRLSTDKPFGVPESARVKNTLIGPRDADGTWATIFRDPQVSGEDRWDIRKDYLLFET